MHLLIHFFLFSYSFSSHSFSYIIWSRVNPFAGSFFFIQLFVFLTFIFILYMKLSQSICWFIFFYSANRFPHIHFHTIYEVESIHLLVHFFLFSKSVSSHSFSYYIWSWVNPFADSFFFIQQIGFLRVIFIYSMKLSQSICWFIFFYSAIRFPHSHFHI